MHIEHQQQLLYGSSQDRTGSVNSHTAKTFHLKLSIVLNHVETQYIKQNISHIKATIDNGTVTNH